MSNSLTLQMRKHQPGKRSALFKVPRLVCGGLEHTCPVWDPPAPPLMPPDCSKCRAPSGTQEGWPKVVTNPGASVPPASASETSGFPNPLVCAAFNLGRRHNRL